MDKGMKKIKLTQNKYALVDDKDFDYLNQFKWCFHDNYAVRSQYNKKSKTEKQILMHRIILKTPKNKITDHIDGNGLNNQRKNLRICTQSGNRINSKISSHNTTGFKGVRWCEDHKKYRSYLTLNKKVYHLEHFLTKEKAAKEYNKAAKKYHSKFARLNKIT
jgi:hypothetical protein